MFGDTSYDASVWHLVDHWTHELAPFKAYGHQTSLPEVIVDALEPTLGRHGIPPAAPGQHGPSVVWCSHVQQIQVRSQDIEDPVSGCTDLWVDLNPDNKTLSVHLEGLDLLLFVLGEGDGVQDPEQLALAVNLVESLSIVARHLDSFCRSVIVIPSS